MKNNNKTKFIQQTEVCKELLKGKTCYTSRRKITENNHNNNEISTVPFGTLHSLSAKITRNNYLENDMEELVEIALRQFSVEFNHPIEITESSITDYYLAIRAFNNGDNGHYLITDKESGFHQILKIYRLLKESKWDWEDSLLNASEYLNKDIIKNHYFFKFDNLVLVSYEKLMPQKDSIAFNFYLSLCHFFYRHQSCNCYFLSDSNLLYKYNGPNELLTPVNPTLTSKHIAFIQN